MPSNPVTKVMEQLRKSVLLQDGPGMSDGQLLDGFVDDRDEAAFEALLRRHGPMVWGVCRRIVGHADDAEDAFQATFLILVRKARAVKPREAVGNWLYGVARNVALKARATSMKLRAKERQVTAMPESKTVPQDHWEALLPLLDEELSRLPDKYRLPLVLCDLEGRARKEVAAQFKIPEGTLSSRLTTARKMLAKRLTGRGVAVSGGTLAAVLAEKVAAAGVPSSVISGTIKSTTLVVSGKAAAAAAISPKVVALVEGGLKAMFLTKLKIATVVLLVVVAVIGGGAGVGAFAKKAPETKHPETAQDARETNEVPAADAPTALPGKEANKPKTDQEHLQGTWKFVSAGQGDKTKTMAIGKGEAEEAEWKTITFTEDKARFVGAHPGGKEVVLKALFKLDPSRKPKTIYLLDGEVKGGTRRGFYELDGDTLRLCFPIEERPAELEGDVGLLSNPLTFKRAATATGEKPAVDAPKSLPADEARKPKTDQERLQGAWEFVSVTQGGKTKRKAEFGQEDAQWKTITFSAEEGEVRFVNANAGGKEVELRAHFKLNPSQKPKTIDVTAESRGERGELMLGIYELDGETLRLCFTSQSSQERPTTLESKEAYLLTYKRVAKSEPKGVIVPPSESVYLPKNLYLVRAKTVEVGTREVAGPSPKASIAEARFEVTKVYLGPDWLMKRPFFTFDQIPFQITVASPLDRLHVNVNFAKGAEGLWWVSYDPQGEGSLRPVRAAGFVDAVGIRPFPYQKILAEGNRRHKTPKDMEASFQEGLSWAEAAEKVYRAASDQERGRLLRAYAAERSPRAAWAIACLAQTGKKELAEFFRKLVADEKQPIASQMVLDGALVSVDGMDWEGSKEQASLYQRWRETYRGLGPGLMPLPLQVLDAQRMQRKLPPLFSQGGLPLGRSGSPTESVYLPKNLYLVRAKTVEVGWKEYEPPGSLGGIGSPQGAGPVKAKLKNPEARFQISQVFLGPDMLKGQHFSGEALPNMRNLSGEPASFGGSAGVLHFNDVQVVFEKNVEGLWWISFDAKQGYRAELRGGTVDANGIRPFPYQRTKTTPGLVLPPKDVEAYFKEGLIWAEAVEKVAKAETDEARATLLRGYAVENSSRGAWAISWLARSREKNSVAFVRKLTVDEKLPFSSQLAIDRGMMAIDRFVEGPQWNGSKDRKGLHERWHELNRKAKTPIITPDIELLMKVQ